MDVDDRLALAPDGRSAPTDWVPLPPYQGLSGPEALARWQVNPCFDILQPSLAPDFYSGNRHLGRGYESLCFSPRPRHTGGQGGWKYWERACVEVGFSPNQRGGWTCAHGASQSHLQPACDSCIEAAIREWWLQYSIAWASFFSSRPSPEDCDAWISSTEHNDQGHSWPL